MIRIASLLLYFALVGTAKSAPSSLYHAITPRMSDQTIVLDGHDLSIDQVIQVARFGAKVVLNPEARQRSADAFALLLEAAAEGRTGVLV